MNSENEKGNKLITLFSCWLLVTACWSSSPRRPWRWGWWQSTTIIFSPPWWVRLHLFLHFCWRESLSIVCFNPFFLTWTWTPTWLSRGCSDFSLFVRIPRQPSDFTLVVKSEGKQFDAFCSDYDISSPKFFDVQRLFAEKKKKKKQQHIMAEPREQKKTKSSDNSPEPMRLSAIWSIKALTNKWLAVLSEGTKSEQQREKGKGILTCKRHLAAPRMCNYLWCAHVRTPDESRGRDSRDVIGKGKRIIIKSLFPACRVETCLL